MMLDPRFGSSESCSGWPPKNQRSEPPPLCSAELVRLQHCRLPWSPYIAHNASRVTWTQIVFTIVRQRLYLTCRKASEAHLVWPLNLVIRSQQAQDLTPRHILIARIGIPYAVVANHAQFHMSVKALKPITLLPVVGIELDEFSARFAPGDVLAGGALIPNSVVQHLPVQYIRLLIDQAEPFIPIFLVERLVLL